MYHVQGYSVNEIIRKTGISRNTIRKIIRAEKAESNYQRKEQPEPRLGDYKEIIESWLIYPMQRKMRICASDFAAVSNNVNKASNFSDNSLSFDFSGPDFDQQHGDDLIEENTVLLQKQNPIAGNITVN